MRLLPPDGEHGFTPYGWLIYLSFYLAYPAATGAAPRQWAITVAGLAVFLPLYFRGYWVDGTRRLPIIGALGALGVALSPGNPGAMSFFIYATAFVGGAVTGRMAAAWIAGLTVLAALTAWLGGVHLVVAMATAVFAPLIGFVNLHYTEVRRRDASLKLAQQEIARLAALAERDRIAGELHDLLGHTLSVIVLKSELVSRLLPRDPARAAAELADVERISREALAEVRRAVQGFRQTTLADELARARAVLATAGLRVEIDARGVVAGERTTGLDAPAEHALALALREAITNVIRHSRASVCRISLAFDGGRARLEIADDGVGGEAVEGNGLQGMRARLLEVGGVLEREGCQGMRIRASVPLVSAVGRMAGAS